MAEPHATIDLETRSECDLRKRGAYNYGADPSTSILCVAYNLPDNDEGTKLWTPRLDLWPCDRDPYDLLEYIESGGLIEAHNSAFERAVINGPAGQNLLWPELKLEQMRCSMAKCRYNSIPGSLAQAGAALNLNIQKDKVGTALIKKLCMPQKITKKNLLRWCDDPELLVQLYRYCIKDVDTEMELSHVLPNMPKNEIAIWLVDQAMNQRGVYIDKELVNIILGMLTGMAEILNSEIADLTKGIVTKGTQTARIKAWCEEQGVHMLGLTKEDVEATLEKDIPDDVERVLHIRQSLGKTSNAKYSAMLVRINEYDERIHDTFVYHKAHSGRWGGANIQLQNLPRPTMKTDPEHIVSVLRTGDADTVEFELGDPFKVASSAIRNVITAAPGNILLSADYSAIEARVLFWLADERRALALLHRGDCIYSDMAATIYGRSYKEIYSGYVAGSFLEEVQRAMGKTTILGLGYQMWVDTFLEQCTKAGNDMTEDQAHHIVTSYRGKYTKVVALWKSTNKAAIAAMARPGVTVKHADDRVQFRKFPRALWCKLPSGRCLHYPDAQLKERVNRWGNHETYITYKSLKNNHWIDVGTYGGKLVENIVQGMARDIMTGPMIKLDKAGYNITMTVHDELVCEVKKGDRHTLKELCALMNTPPEWGEDIPLAVSGWEGKRYRK